MLSSLQWSWLALVVARVTHGWLALPRHPPHPTHPSPLPSPPLPSLSRLPCLTPQANPSVTNRFNETPLHLAVKKGADEVVYLLLRNQAAVDTVNTTDGATALFYAVTKGYSECVRLLVRAGADPHFVIASTGESILQLACNGTNVETLRQITEVVNVNAPLQNGRTALHWACFYGKMPFVRQLVARGASTHVVDEEGCTPLFWAVYSGHTNVVRQVGSGFVCLWWWRWW
jgi:ankyrin repeat protein